MICRILESEDTLVNFGPIVIVGKGRKDAVQVDLALETSDRSIFVCECKYHDATIGLDVIDEMKSKLVKIKFPSRMTVKKVLISLHGASNELKQAQFFDAMITAQDLLRIK